MTQLNRSERKEIRGVTKLKRFFTRWRSDVKMSLPLEQEDNLCLVEIDLLYSPSGPSTDTFDSIEVNRRKSSRQIAMTVEHLRISTTVMMHSLQMNNIDNNR